MRVFISHSTKDVETAQALCEHLEAEGIACWIAPRDIKAGQDWSATIPPAFDACNAMVLVLSSHANASRQIAHEGHIAHSSGAAIVPLRIEPVNPAGALRYLLSGIHYIDLLGEQRAAAFDELVALLHELEKHGAAALLHDRPDEADIIGLRSRRTNMPLQLTSFVGRSGELERLRSDIARTRLLTLTGTGGVGKTRLAAALANESLSRYEHGVWYVDLAQLGEAETVESAVVAALSITPSPAQSAIEALRAGIREKHLLLMLDGCDRARVATAALVEGIVRSCPNVSVVATSRQVLGIDGEVVHGVGPLTEEDSIELFIERAKAASNAFTVADEMQPTVAHICQRLDGIPLAIELAAAKVHVLGLRQLDERLRERFRVLAQTGGSRLARQQTLRATIDWSFDLLDERARALFRRLSIFSGGWTLDAAAQVCTDGSDLDEWSVLDALSSLVDKSLVITESFGDDQRYRMLSSIREYGSERLAQANELEGISAKHARYVAGVVRAARALVQELQDIEWSRRLAPDVDNIRAALDWTIVQANEPLVGMSLLADLELPELLMTPQEALTRFEVAAQLAQLRAGIDPLVHAKLLRHCALLEWHVGRPLAQRERTALNALEVARATNDADEIARALANLGANYRLSGRFDEAGEAFREAYQTPRSLSRLTTNAVLRAWAVSDLQRGDIELARRRFSEVARLERAGSEAHASALLNVGELEFASGNIAAAREAAVQARATYAALNSVYQVLVLCNLAAYAMEAGDLDDARAHLRQALHFQRRSGAGWLGTVLEHHALFAGLLGDFERAAVLVGFTDALLVVRGDVRERTERHGYERLMGLLGRQYAAEELASRLGAGSRLTDEEALAHAEALHESHRYVAAMPSKER
ncbi:MAG: TIR domain-containing protein [Candidatus Eremiobacteraeota bacterium]|nr:TIR domain-containing protein [Candidatus Eremiobacteraeota bacterium]